MNENYLNYFDGNYTINFFSPSSLLKPFLEDYSYFLFPSDKLINTNMHSFPNGNIEIYFCLRDSKVLVKQYNNEYYIKSFLLGIFNLSDSTLFRTISNDSYYASLIVHLKFSSLKYLFNVPLGRFKNKIIDIEELWGQKGKDIKKFLSKQNDISVIVSFVNNFFESFLKNKDLETECKFEQIIECCQKKEGMIAVEELSNDFNISYRTLHRTFIRGIGVSPKEYLKILRFNKVCKVISENPQLNWSDLIYLCGYYDQSHFIRDFKGIMKYTPQYFCQLTKGKFYLKRPYFLAD